MRQVKVKRVLLGSHGVREVVIGRAPRFHLALAFDLHSAANAGLITIDLAESNDAHREKVRAKFDEPYRTMLGHFRHEIGNYYEGLPVEGEPLTEANRRERSP